MPKVTKKEEVLLSQIIKSLEDRKAHDITCLDLRKNDDAIVDYFVICHGDSTTQVNAIAVNLERDILDNLKEKPFHMEGENNAMWVIVDYVNIVVHIFYKETRDFYQLEELWSDSIEIK